MLLLDYCEAIVKLFLIRHPQPEIEKGLCYGALDLDLAPAWEEDATQLSNWLFSRIKGRCESFHSPLQRASKLAYFLNPESVQASALRELDFGLWEGRLWSEIERQEIDEWSEDIVHSAPYQGESLYQVKHRVMEWWQALLSQYQDNQNLPDNLILVAHSGVIKVLVSQLCGWPLAQSHLINPGMMSVTELYLYGDFVQLNRLGAGDWL